MQNKYIKHLTAVIDKPCNDASTAIHDSKHLKKCSHGGHA
jgi:hypothetical protein